MLKSLPFRLHTISVVVTAEYHNPSILNPDFLKHNKVVPAKWAHTETLTTPGYSTVTFENGVKWVIEPEKMNLIETKNVEFGANVAVHRVAEKYVSLLPHVPYAAIGLNCQVSMPKPDPSKWIMDRFLKTGKWLNRTPAILDAAIKIKIDASPAVCNLTISSGTNPTAGGKQEDSVLIDCNFHHKGPYRAKQIKDIFKAWPNEESILINSLKKLLTGRLV